MVNAAEEKQVAKDALQDNGGYAKNHAGVAKSAAGKAPLSEKEKSHAHIRNKEAKRRKRHGEKIADGLQNLPLAKRENRARAAASGAVDMQALGNAASEEIRACFLRVCIGEGVEKNEKKKRNLQKKPSFGEHSFGMHSFFSFLLFAFILPQSKKIRNPILQLF